MIIRCETSGGFGGGHSNATFSDEVIPVVSLPKTLDPIPKKVYFM